MLQPRCYVCVHKRYFDSLQCWALYSIAQPKGHGVDRVGFRNFPTGGQTLLIWGLKYSCQGTLNVKSLQKYSFHLPIGARMFQWWDYSPLALS